MKNIKNTMNSSTGRKKILHVFPLLICGGVERVIEDIIRFSDSKRFEFEILTQEEGDNEEVFRKLGVRILRIPYNGDDARYREELRRLFEEESYDAVHCHSHREMSILNLEAKATGIPVRIAHCHNAHQDIRGWRNWLRRFKFRRHARGATDLIGCSRDALNWMFPQKDSRKRIITNGISTQRFHFNEKVRRKLRNESGLPDSTTVILNIGRASDQKNQAFILRIAAKDNNPNHLYVILGDGPLLEQLKHRAQDLNLENIIFLGERRDAEEWLSAADIFLFPSIFEGHPLAPMEAQATGLPVLASEIIPPEAQLIPSLFHKIRGWHEQDWLNAIEKLSNKNHPIENRILSCANTKQIIEKLADASLTAKNFAEVYDTARMIYCDVRPLNPITGGEIYNARFLTVTSEATATPTSTLTLCPTSSNAERSERNTSLTSKIVLPWRGVAEVRRRLKDYSRKGLPAPVLIFNTSKCLYFLPSLLYLKLRGAKSVGITHHPLYIQMKGIKKAIYKHAELAFLRLLSVRVVPSEFTGRLLKAKLPDLDFEFIPIPFGHQSARNKSFDEEGGKGHNEVTDTKKISKTLSIPKKTSKFANNYVQLLAIGTIEPRKGHHYLLEAMNILKGRGLKCRLKIVGNEVDASYSEILRQLADRYDLKIEWEGYVSEIRKRELLEEADIFVLPSEAEGFGIVMVEAMMAGTPVVAFRNSGIVDVVGADEERGLLADDRDVHSLAAKIDLFITDNALRNQKINRALDWSQQLPTYEDFDREISDLCGNILQL